MLTARDVLSTSDSVAEVFKIGLSDANITTDFAKSADVAEIALMVLRRQGEFVFKLTGYLLRGITCLYYKKTVLVLENCEEIMMRISLRFEEAKKNTKAPTIIEFIIDPEEMVYPMIKPGGTLEDMIMDC